MSRHYDQGGGYRDDYGGRPAPPPPPRGRGPPDIRDTHSLLVLNITFRTTADDLMPLFDRYGQVVDIFIPRDRRTGTSRGFAFVRYKRLEEAQKAIDRLDGRSVDGREIMVKFAKYGRNEEVIEHGRIQDAGQQPPRHGSDRPRGDSHDERRKERDFRDRDWDREGDRDRDRDYDRGRDRDRDRDRDKDRDRDRDRDRDKDRDKDKDRDRDRDKNRDRERSRERDDERERGGRRKVEEDSDDDRRRSRKRREEDDDSGSEGGRGRRRRGESEERRGRTEEGEEDSRKKRRTGEEDVVEKGKESETGDRAKEEEAGDDAAGKAENGRHESGHGGHAIEEVGDEAAADAAGNVGEE